MKLTPTVILRVEATIIFALSCVVYAQLELSWWYWLLLLVPDVFMVGYAKSKKLGALTYNIGHSYVTPVLLALVAYLLDWKLGYGLAAIWAAHIAMDRMLGYGLKTSEGFEHTHLGLIGKKKKN